VLKSSKTTSVTELALLLLLHHTPWAYWAQACAAGRATKSLRQSWWPQGTAPTAFYAGPAPREDEARKEKGLGSTSSEAAAWVCFKCNNSLCSEVSWASNWCLSLCRRWYMARRACASERCEDSLAISSCPPSRSRHELQKTRAHV
jgi:hypothetical protein